MSTKYDTYLTEHKKNVGLAFKWIAYNIPELLNNKLTKRDVERIMYDHDKSKSDLINEYNAYDKYFYGQNELTTEEEKEKIKKDFDYAWNHHIHNNPHHWEYWLLYSDVTDNSKSIEGITALKIPYSYIIEMICDWWSFSFKSHDLEELYSWFWGHKDDMLINEKSMDEIVKIICLIMDQLHYGVNGLGVFPNLTIDKLPFETLKEGETYDY